MSTYRVRVKETMTETTDYLEAGGYRDVFLYPDMALDYKEFEVVDGWEPNKDGVVAKGWYQGAYAPDDYIWHESWLDFIEEPQPEVTSVALEDLE